MARVIPARTTRSVGAISGRLLLRLVDFVARRGHDPDALCRAVGLHRPSLGEPGTRVSYAIAERLGARAAAVTGDANLGLHLALGVGEALPHDAGALLLMASPTVRVALERMVRYQSYWGDGPRSALAACPGGLALRYVHPWSEGVLRRHADECAIAEILVGIRLLAEHDVTPRAVHFRHPAPPDTREHAALFRCPVRFGETHTALHLDDATLDLPLPHADATYSAIFQAQVEVSLAALPQEDSMSDAVRSAVGAGLGVGTCTLAATARALGTSARTLQRRLSAEGTTFAEVVDSLRRASAEGLLQAELPLGEIAVRLGYSEPSAFHHAFKRWTGQTPEQARASRRALG